mmetsp:Transcript_41050/g.102064  ORF Transcript_41050/g.102064 Transcript_41050/m.102064 type:complete len:205 (+) Transcript_41050:344-958(+)
MLVMNKPGTVKARNSCMTMRIRRDDSQILAPETHSRRNLALGTQVPWFPCEIVHAHAKRRVNGLLPGRESNSTVGMQRLRRMPQYNLLLQHRTYPFQHLRERWTILRHWRPAIRKKRIESRRPRGRAAGAFVAVDHATVKALKVHSVEWLLVGSSCPEYHAEAVDISGTIVRPGERDLGRHVPRTACFPCHIHGVWNLRCWTRY